MAGTSLRGFLIASLFIGVLAPAAGAEDGPGFVREFLAVGNWRDVRPDQQLLGPDELPFEGLALRGCLLCFLEQRVSVIKFQLQVPEAVLELFDPLCGVCASLLNLLSRGCELVVKAGVFV